MRVSIMNLIMRKLMEFKTKIDRWNLKKNIKQVNFTPA